MGGSRARTDEEELTGASGRSGDWTSQSKTDLMAQSVANGLNAIAGGGGMALAGAAVRALARVVPRYVPSNAIFNNGDSDQSATGQERTSPVLNPEGVARAAKNGGNWLRIQPVDATD